MAGQKKSASQLPQIIILGVLIAGVAVWGGMQWMGSQAKADPAPAQAGAAADPGPAVAAVPGAKPGDPGVKPAGGESQLVPPGLGFKQGYNPDPFRPIGQPDQPVVVRPSVPPPPVHWSPPPSLPAMGPDVPAGPVEPPAPVRPSLAVTGIIDVQEGADMALIEANQQQRIIQVGDLIDTYRVKKIGLDGIVLVNGSDRFFVALNAVEALAAPKG